jgi:1-acyl-sn-glycerol-3-phosphate acyltransferase
MNRYLNIHTIFQLLSSKLILYVTRYTGFLDMKTEGLPPIDPNKRYIFVSNHQSYMDVYVMFMGFPSRIIARACPVHYMTSPRVYFTLLMPIIWLGGGFPTKRKRAGYHAVDHAVQLLDNHQTVVIFPEGKRSAPGVTPAHSGVQRIIDGASIKPEIILVHLDWDKQSWFHRKLRVAYKEYHGDIDASAMMRAIYAL